MNLRHKGYLGRAEIDQDAGVIRGEVVNTTDTITFQGKTVEEAADAFRESVDDYLTFCQELGEPPEPPFSGTFLIHLAPEFHRDLSLQALTNGQSLNAFVAEQLERFAGGTDTRGSSELQSTVRKPERSARAEAATRPSSSTTSKSPDDRSERPSAERAKKKRGSTR